MNLHQAVTDFITAYDREGIQSPELAEKLGKVRDAIEVLDNQKNHEMGINALAVRLSQYSQEEADHDH